MLHRPRPRLIAAPILCMALGPMPAMGQPSDDDAGGGPDRLVVATKEAAPYAMKAEDGSWRGLSIDLWERVAADLGVTYEFVEMDLEDTFGALEAGEIDAAVSALTITPEREAAIDFSHPFQVAGLGVAVSEGEAGGGLLGVLKALFSRQFITAIAALTGLLLIVGAVAWFFEHKRNAEQFGGGPVRGLGSGLWWSAVTMTTVGYGDKAPVTVPGRVVGLIWMFASIIIISGFTAAIASALTIGSLQSSIRDVSDLRGRRVAVVADSTSESFLRGRSVGVRTYATVDEAASAAATGQADAVVHDRPILRYLVNDSMDDLRVLTLTFERQDYGIALPNGSPRREAVNRSILAFIVSEEWTALRTRYLGGEE